MLTKLGVDGFKNLKGLEIEFGPFTCIAGPNGVGKSNVFDAIQFLSLLADRPLMEAADGVRLTRDERSSDPRDLFSNGDTRSEMRLTAEMTVPLRVADDFGQVVEPTISFLRYEVVIGYESSDLPASRSRLVLIAESLRHINISDAPHHIHFPHKANTFRSKVVTGKRSGGAFISTRTEGEDRVITVHQDGGSRGQPRRASATRAPSTVVSTITVADDPTVLAAKREMQSWRRLALEPTSLRSADRFVDARSLTSDGRHLPATLHRIATESQDYSAVLSRVATRLSALTGVSVRNITVDSDTARELLTLRMCEESGSDIPARSLSEGTLRFLALCILLEDPEMTGVICMEEPENGIHPSNVPAMIQLLRDLAVDPFEEPGPLNPVRQVIINTHSPIVVQVVGKDDLLFATSRAVDRDSEGSWTRALDLRPMHGSWRDVKDHSRTFGIADVIPYLTAPPDGQLSIRGDITL